MISISNFIKAERQKLGYTQQNMADKLNVSYATYNQYENDPLSMKIKTFIKLCDIFGENFITIFFTDALYKVYKNGNSQEKRE